MLLTVRNNRYKRMLKLNLNFLPNVTWAKNFYYCQMFSLEIKYETNTETFKKWQTSVKIKDDVQQIGAENSINLLRFINHRKPLSISQLPQEVANNPVTTTPPHLSSPHRGLCCSTLVFHSLTSQVPLNQQIKTYWQWNGWLKRVRGRRVFPASLLVLNAKQVLSRQPSVWAHTPQVSYIDSYSQGLKMSDGTLQTSQAGTLNASALQLCLYIKWLCSVAL